MKILSVALLFILVHTQLNAQQKEFNWLLGNWKLKDKNSFEVWSLDKDSKSLSAISYHVSGADTTITEAIKLKFDQGAFYYIPDVAGEQGQIPFKITQHDQQSFVAENPTHDFPKIIRYTHTQKGKQNSIEATIEGDGKVIHYTFFKQ